MNTISTPIRCLTAAFAFLLVATNLNKASANDEAGSLIEMENVPLSGAIYNLTRQLELNCILDPRLLSPRGGTLLSDPPITVRWENITVQEALLRVLKEHALVLVTNAATSVARIVPANVSVRPIPASAVGKDTNGVIPVLIVDYEPLAEAIKMLATRSGLSVSFDPTTKSVFITPDVFEKDILVSFRWQNLTARQALAALLDNYDLAMIEETGKYSARIVRKAQVGKEGPAGK